MKAVAAALGLGAFVVAAPSLAAPAPYPQALIARATAKIHTNGLYKKAIFLEADGTPKPGTKVKTAAGIVNWRLVYDNQPGQNQYKTVFMFAKSGKLGPPVPNKSLFEESRRIQSLPKMTLAQAVAKLRAAGHRQPFGAATLRYPIGVGFNQPLYIFTFGGGDNVTYWAVGTKNGKVRPLS